jgi:hypothetical protein
VSLQRDSYDTNPWLPGRKNSRKDEPLEVIECGSCSHGNSEGTGTRHDANTKRQARQGLSNFSFAID